MDKECGMNGKGPMPMEAKPNALLGKKKPMPKGMPPKGMPTAMPMAMKGM